MHYDNNHMVLASACDTVHLQFFLDGIPILQYREHEQSAGVMPAG